MENGTNDRKTIGMNGSGFIEMLARQMTAHLQAERDATTPGRSKQLMSKGSSFGVLTHNLDGTWNTSQVQGLPAPSLSSKGTAPPSLIIRPLHQAGNVVSVRQFSNNAFNHHHGMQSEERFGLNTDADGDGFSNELTVADLTAVSMFQATLAVPGRVIPNDPAVERANLLGEALFNHSWLRNLPCYSASHGKQQPRTAWAAGLDLFRAKPVQPCGWPELPNLQLGPANYPVSAPALLVDLTSDALPLPRLRPQGDVVIVPAYTDLKLHDTSARRAIRRPIPNANRSTKINRLAPRVSSPGTANS